MRAVYIITAVALILVAVHVVLTVAYWISTGHPPGMRP